MKSPVKIWRNQKKLQLYIGKRGTIVSFTVIRVPPSDFVSSAPYAVAIVELENKQRITAQVTDCDLSVDLIGKQVAVVIRRVTQPNQDGVIPYGVKVKLLSMANDI